MTSEIFAVATQQMVAHPDVSAPTALSALPPDLARFVGARLQAASAVAELGRPGASLPKVLGAENADDPAWQSVQTPALSLQFDVDMVSSEEAWAVTLAADGQPSEILRYRDAAWRVVEQYGPERYLWAVDMTAPGEGWIAGFDTGGPDLRGVLLPVRAGEVGEPIPNTCDSLLDVHMFGAGDGWAVGNEVTGETASSCILRHSNGTWERTESPGDALLVAVQMVSPDEGWAIGSKGALLHFRAGEWKEAASPVQAGSTDQFYDLAIAGGKGWAVGSNAQNTLRYQDGIWRVVDLGFPGSFSGVDMVSAAEGWAVGYALPDPNGPLVFAFQVEGERWTAVESPAFQYRQGGIDMLSATDGWAVGQQSSARFGMLPATATASATATSTRTATATLPPPPPSPSPSMAPIFLPSVRRD